MKALFQLMIKPFLFVIIFIVLFGCASTQTGNSIEHDNFASIKAEKKLVTTQPVPGITQKFLLAVPENPIGILILLPGSRGILRLSESFGQPVINNLRNNFLVRTYGGFVRRDFIVALVDCPDEMISAGGLMMPHRGGPQHRNGVSSVIDYCRNIYNLPVWLVGTSAGTVSVASLGISLRDKLDGLIFTSSVTDMSHNKYMSSFKNGIIDYALFMIEGPVFIAAHANDGCKYTPPEKTDMLKEKLSNSPNVIAKIYHGGRSGVSDPCVGRTPHGFYGIEEIVINDIVEFIKRNSPSN